MEKMPVLFVGHGSPMNAIEDNAFSRAWTALGDAFPVPKAILSVSAHWFTRETLVNDSAAPEMIYDMYGFPEALYRLKYPAPGSPALAHRVHALIGERIEIDNGWGIDHGTWSVLRRVYPSADIPIVQLSVNARLSPAEHLALGRTLKPLRDEGVLIFGSGNVVHNLSLVDWSMDDGYPWAEEFDAFIRRAVTSRTFDDVANYRQAGRPAELAVPTPDHFSPLLYALGASDEHDALRVFNDACLLGSMSMTSYLFTPEQT